MRRDAVEQIFREGAVRIRYREAAAGVQIGKDRIAEQGSLVPTPDTCREVADA